MFLTPDESQFNEYLVCSFIVLNDIGTIAVTFLDCLELMLMIFILPYINNVQSCLFVKVCYVGMMINNRGVSQSSSTFRN
jgi:hypothetical protein